jgi:hypothetical protein
MTKDIEMALNDWRTINQRGWVRARFECAQFANHRVVNLFIRPINESWLTVHHYHLMNDGEVKIIEAGL